MASDHDGTARALILTLAVCGFGSTFAGRITEPLVGVIARDLATDPATIALLSAAFTLPYAFIQPILGPVGDGIGKGRVMQACIAVLVASLAASAFAPSATTLFVLRIVAGAAAGGVIPLALAMIGDRVAMERRQVAISRFLVAVILGQLCGSSFSGLMAEAIGWRGAFLAAALIASIGCAAAILRLRPSGRATGEISVSGALARYRDLILLPRARALFLLVFAEALAIFGVFPYVAPLLEARSQAGPAEAGLALGGFAVGGLAYTAVVALLLRRLGVSGMVAGGGIFACGALLGLGFAGDWRVVAGLMILLGFAFYMLHNSFQAQVTEVAPTARGSAVAIHAFSFFCGQALGVVLVGIGLRGIGPVGTLAVGALGILAVGLVAARVLRSAT